MSDDLAKEIARGALRIDWYNTETAARRVAEHAADRIAALEAERDALAAQLVEAVGVLKGLTDAMDAVDAEAERADQPGATAWSSAPVVALRYKRLEARATLAKLEAKT